MPYPDWVVAHRKKGQEIRFTRGRYYVYQVSSVYDSKKKRSKKITVKYLGTLTESEGLIPSIPGVNRRGRPKKAHSLLSLPYLSSKIVVKEYGATSLISQLSNTIIEALKEVYPEWWMHIFSLSALRLITGKPLQEMQGDYATCYLSEQDPRIGLNKNTLTALLRYLGIDRQRAVSFMSRFIEGSEHLVFDVTDISTESRGIKMAAEGYNSHGNTSLQLNMFYIFSIDKQIPVYYRIFSGDVSGMKALKLSLKEAQVKKSIAIGDKGFFSRNNLHTLIAMGLKFIIPLKRSSIEIDYSRLRTFPLNEAFDGFFMYQNRAISYYTPPDTKVFLLLNGSKPLNKFCVFIFQCKGKWKFFFDEFESFIKDHNVEKWLNTTMKSSSKKGSKQLGVKEMCVLEYLQDALIKKYRFVWILGLFRKVFLFCDKKLRLSEEADYQARMYQKIEGYNKEGFKRKDPQFGTLSLMTNCLKAQPEELYRHYKTRMEIEDSFDAYKNLLKADRSYMQSDESMNGWVFINHISTMMYYQVLHLLKEKGLLSTHSPRRVLCELAKINKVKVMNIWHTCEQGVKKSKLCEKLELSI